MIDKAAKYLGITEVEVLDHKLYENEIVLIVDKGIKGGIKTTVTFEELDQPPPVDNTEDDLTKILGVGKKRAKDLQALGIKSFFDLSQFSPDVLSRDVPNLAIEQAQEWIGQAKELTN